MFVPKFVWFKIAGKRRSIHRLSPLNSPRNATVKVPRDLETLEFKMVTAGATAGIAHKLSNCQHNSSMNFNDLFLNTHFLLFTAIKWYHMISQHTHRSFSASQCGRSPGVWGWIAYMGTNLLQSPLAGNQTTMAFQQILMDSNVSLKLIEWSTSKFR